MKNNIIVFKFAEQLGCEDTNFLNNALHFYCIINRTNSILL
ncbi:MAG: hypothetical protein BWY47_02095 [Bacteroidetes bacterium ADurb.Bin302]|jgi:hypothetical protein|nr:MAG: hypothetical protein BWY47_02095 [Bacteroidetes bacterium ADurb.Bin302]